MRPHWPYSVSLRGAVGHAAVALPSAELCCNDATGPDAAYVITCNMPGRSLAAKWNMPAELAIDVAALALYDVVVMAGVFHLHLSALHSLR